MTSFKSRIILGLLLFSLAWATTISVLYWRLKNNPRVVAVTTDSGKGLLPQEQLSEVEKVTFLRQYLERYFNYDSNNFWQSQTSLAFLMSPRLSEERIREVRRLREKIQQKNLSQQGQLVSLRQLPSGDYEARVALLTKEEQQKQSAPEALYVTVDMSLQDTERTLENPWGLLVKTMSFKNSPQPFALTTDLSLHTQIPAAISFPCALQNIENSSEDLLKTKITTLNISELQITLTGDIPAPVFLIALCKEREYKFEIKTASAHRDLFLVVSGEMGEVRKRDLPGKPRKKDAYEQTIEKVLGIELEN